MQAVFDEIQELNEFQVDQVSGGCPFLAFAAGVGAGLTIVGIFVAAGG